MTDGLEGEGAAPAVTKRDVAKGAGTTLLARLGNMFEIVAQPLYVAMFGLAGYGLYAALWSAVNISQNSTDLGMPSALQRIVPKASDDAEAAAAVRLAIMFGVLPALLLALAVWLAAGWIAPLFNAADADAGRLVESIRLFIWALPAWAMVEVTTAALRAKRVFGAEIRLRMVWEQLIRFAIATGLWFAGSGTTALFWAHLLSLCIVALLALRLLSRYYSLADVLRAPVPSGLRAEMLKAGIAAQPATLSQRLFSDGPPLALNWLLPGAAGAVAGGLFAIARKIASVVQLVRIAFSYVLAPLAAAASTGHKRDVDEIYGFASRLLMAIALPVTATLSGAGPALLALFGKDAVAAQTALGILILGRAAEAVLGAAQPIQQAISGYKSQLAGSLGGLAVLFGTGLALLPEGGLVGMAVAVALGLLAASGLPVIQLALLDGYHPFARPFVRVAATALAVSIAGFAALRLAEPLGVGALLAILVPVALGCLWLSLRLALPRGDREALGATGRKLGLA